MSQAMLDFIAFQSYVTRTNSTRRAERLPQIKCKHEKQQGAVCAPDEREESCLECARERRKESDAHTG